MCYVAMWRPEGELGRMVQTAIVVGKAGKEIHTDELGRVKLKFPWFRFGNNEEGRALPLGARVASLGGPGLGGDAHSAHRARSDRPVPGGRSGKKEAKVTGMYAITADQEFLATSGETMLDMHDAYIKLDNIASKLIFDAGAATLDGQGSVEVKSGFNTVTIKKSGEIEVKATSKVSIEGATEVTLKSDVTVKISAPVVEIVGDTMIKLNS